MNDMAATSQHVTQQAGGITHLDTEELNALLRRTPFNRSGYVRPLDEARRRRAGHRR